MEFSPEVTNAIAIFLPATVAFLIGIGITPLITNFLYRNKLWKKESGKVDLAGNETPVFNDLHAEKEVGTPRMGGVIIWMSVLLTTGLFTVLASTSSEFLTNLDFLTRSQTWLPVFTLLVGSLVGLVDDWLEVKTSGTYLAGGLSLKIRLLLVAGMGLVGGLWFYLKLGVSSIMLPIIGSFGLGWLFVPFFMLVIVATYSGGTIDGLDGLAGGVFATQFAAYGIIAYSLGQVDLAALCLVIIGGILAFLWFNIPPARFYMTETGSMALTTTLAVIAFLTNTVLFLPIIAFPLVATTGSSLLQVASKRLRNKKVFMAAPLHHHFEAIGWSEPKVVMRYWIVSIIGALFGTVLALIFVV